MTQTKTLHAAFAGHVAQALDALEAAGTLPAGLNRAAVAVEPPRDPAHGDLATNAAMVLAKEAKAKPRDLADKIADKLRADPQHALGKLITCGGDGTARILLASVDGLLGFGCRVLRGTDLYSEIQSYCDRFPDEVRSAPAAAAGR